MSRQYDLVFLIHSIFAFENGKALDKVLSLPKKDGEIVVMSNAPDSFLAGLKSLVDDDYEDKRYEINDLQRDLDKRRISHTHLTFETRWAISKQDYDNVLKLILDWISLGSYESFSIDKKNSISEYISKYTLALDGRILFTENEAVLIIPAL